LNLIPLVHPFVLELGVIDEYHLVPLLALVPEDALQHTDQL
jgi:hypothetical protein